MKVIFLTISISLACANVIETTPAKPPLPQDGPNVCEVIKENKTKYKCCDGYKRKGNKCIKASLKPKSTKTPRTKKPKGTKTPRTKKPKGTKTPRTKKPKGTKTPRTKKPKGTKTPRTEKLKGTKASRTKAPKNNRTMQTRSPKQTRIARLPETNKGTPPLPATKIPTSSSTNLLHVAIGISVGAALILFVIIFVIYKMCRSHKKCCFGINTRIESNYKDAKIKQVLGRKNEYVETELHVNKHPPENVSHSTESNPDLYEAISGSISSDYQELTHNSIVLGMKNEFVEIENDMYKQSAENIPHHTDSKSDAYETISNNSSDYQELTHNSNEKDYEILTCYGVGTDLKKTPIKQTLSGYEVFPGEEHYEQPYLDFTQG